MALVGYKGMSALVPGGLQGAWLCQRDAGYPSVPAGCRVPGDRAVCVTLPCPAGVWV